MTDHDRFLELAAISIDFELAPDERAELDAHLAVCRSCRDAVAELTTQPGLLAALPATDAPERVRRTVLAAAAEATARATRGGRRSQGLLAAQVALVAALAIAPLGLAVLVLRDLDLGLGFGAGAGAPTAGSPGSIAWESVMVPSPEQTPRPSGDALEPSLEPSGAPPASAEPSAAASQPPGPAGPQIELVAVTVVDGRIVAVGHACGSFIRTKDFGDFFVAPQAGQPVECALATVVVDGGRAASWVGADETYAAMPDGSWSGLRDVTVAQRGFVAVGTRPVNGRAHAAAWRSDDGSSWRLTDYTPDFADGWMNAVTVLDDGSLVAVGGVASADGISAAVWTSDDGAAWLRVPDDPALAAGAGGTVRAGRPEAGMWDVILVGDRLVAVGSVCETAVGDCVATVWSSTDGRAWERSPTSGLGDGSGTAAAAAGDRIVAVGAGAAAALAWSLEPDGTTTQRAFPPTRAGALLTASSSGGLVASAGVAGTEAGGVWLSSGEAWTFVGDELLAGSTVLDIAIDGDRLVAVGDIGGDPAGILVGRLEGFER